MSMRRMQYSVSRATGRYGLPGEIDITWEPRQAVAGSPTVLLLHGMLGNTDYFFDYTATNPRRLLIGPILASYGLRVIAIDGGTRTAPGAGQEALWDDYALFHWGNPNHTARMETVRSSLGVSQLALVGLSMGNYAALQYAVNHPTRVSAMVALSGCCDIVDFYNDNGNPAYMANPWNVTAPAALPSPADITNHANLVGKPWRAIHCQDDTTVSYSSVQAMAAHIGSSADLISYPTGDHTGTLDQMNLEDIVSWIWDYS